VPTDHAPDPAELLRLAIELATDTAELVRRRHAEHFATSAKTTATDLVTEVDTAAERFLVERLAQRRPDDAILGEEGGGRPGRTPVRWLLDPIDGTVNFVLGLPQYAVSVAAEVNGVVVAGAVCNPATGELYSAERGRGAQLGDQPLRGPREVPLARAVIATGFGYDAALRARQGAVAAALLPQVGDLRRLGSAALDLCFLAAGRLDGYFEAGLNPWDSAAGGLIAQEAGCVLSGLRGRPPSGQLFAAAGAAFAADFFELLESLEADLVST
jgi:myo-inositol-1(or 4)-monophosphatase